MDYNWVSHWGWFRPFQPEVLELSQLLLASGELHLSRSTSPRSSLHDIALALGRGATDGWGMVGTVGEGKNAKNAARMWVFQNQWCWNSGGFSYNIKHVAGVFVGFPQKILRHTHVSIKINSPIRRGTRRCLSLPGWFLSSFQAILLRRISGGRITATGRKTNGMKYATKERWMCR